MALAAGAPLPPAKEAARLRRWVSMPERTSVGDWTSYVLAAGVGVLIVAVAVTAVVNSDSWRATAFSTLGGLVAALGVYQVARTTERRKDELTSDDITKYSEDLIRYLQGWDKRDDDYLAGRYAELIDEVVGRLESLGDYEAAERLAAERAGLPTKRVHKGHPVSWDVEGPE